MCILCLCFRKRSWPDAVWCGAGVLSRAQLIIMFSTQRARAEKGAQLAKRQQQTHGARTQFLTAEHGHTLHSVCTSLIRTFGLHWRHRANAMHPCFFLVCFRGFFAHIFNFTRSCCFQPRFGKPTVYNGPEESILDTRWTFTTQHRIETCKWDKNNFFGVNFVVFIKLASSQKRGASSRVFRNN